MGARRRLAGGFAMVLAVSACTSGPSAGPTTTVAPTTTSPPARTEDGVLRIGVLLPSSGAGASIVGDSARAAIQAAVSTANAAGGVLGADVELVVQDEGSDANAAAVGLRNLIDADVDVLIGPASSNIAIALMSSIVDAGIATCSPSASALALDVVPDDGLFFRTIPSDSLQADALATVIERTGERSASIAYVDDGYGRPFEAALESALRARGIDVEVAVGYLVGDDDYGAEATRIVNGGDGAIALIGDPDGGARMLAALAVAGRNSPRDIVVNDALRQPFSLSLVSAFSAEARERVVGVSPEVRTTNQTVLDQIAALGGSGLFAGQAYDCANLFMLAAEQVQSSSPRLIADAIADISAVGSTCATFASCRDLIVAGRGIDFGGTDGLLAIAADGDLVTARYEQFSFDATGRDVTTQSIVVPSFSTTVGE